MKFRLTTTNRNMLIVGIIALIGLFGWFSMLQPKVNQVKLSQDKLASLQQNFADLKRVADQKPLFIALTKRIQSRLSGVEMTADARAYVPSYLKQIETLAQRDGMVVTSVVPVPAPAATGTPNPNGTPGTASVANAPIIGAPLKSAARAAGAENANTQTTTGVAAATGATPIPGASPAPSAPVSAPVTAVPAASAAAPGSPRSNAIAYVNQSFAQLPINMELDGTYSQAERFFRDLNRFPKLLGVGDVTLAPKMGAVGETPRLHIILPLVAYQLDAASAGVRKHAAPGATGSHASASGNGG
ncbi:MAG: type 4a pilus biogenesis protein PilO [Candidatus Eremiobacteraeota bacterium]|nr:type 4a pilus biogenesis protein PilO [Candidatus Eremiobacteraeota bacterium]MBC5827416.1 type 4a pilus biogenesis protein PilO [Candidatus Eremiobacteraeota bacterium]